MVWDPIVCMAKHIHFDNVSYHWQELPAWVSLALGGPFQHSDLGRSGGGGWIQGVGDLLLPFKEQQLCYNKHKPHPGWGLLIF